MFSHQRLSKLPPLKPLKGFEATARLLSVSRAAEELNLTPPAITHQVKTLEDSLGVKLFEKRGRNLLLTDEGRRLYPSVRAALEKLVVGVSTLGRMPSCCSPLCVQTYITASIRWFAPRLFRFRNEYPDIPLQLLTNGHSWKFEEEKADLGFIFADSPPPAEYFWKPLFKYELYPVCSPELAEGNAVNCAEDLLSLPLLVVYGEETHWNIWFESVGVKHDIAPFPMIVDTLAMAIEIVKQGEGIVLMNGPFVEKELAAGTLIQPVKQKVELGDWGLICRQYMTGDKRVESFIQWMEQEVHASVALKSGTVRAGMEAVV